MASGFDNNNTIIAELCHLLGHTYCTPKPTENQKGNEFEV